MDMKRASRRVIHKRTNKRFRWPDYERSVISLDRGQFQKTRWRPLTTVEDARLARSLGQGWGLSPHSTKLVSASARKVSSYSTEKSSNPVRA